MSSTRKMPEQPGPVNKWRGRAEAAEAAAEVAEAVEAAAEVAEVEAAAGAGAAAAACRGDHAASAKRGV